MLKWFNYFIMASLVLTWVYILFVVRKESGVNSHNEKIILLSNDKEIGSKALAETPPIDPIVSRYNKPEDFEGFDNVSGTHDGCYIVPNYVHFVRLSQPTFRFVDAVIALAAFKNQKPEKIFFHTDVDFEGKYWEVLMNTKGFKEALVIKKVVAPTEIFGQKLSTGWKQHSGDVVRLRVMMEYGGIYLDNDSYIVKSLNDFRRFEMTLGWMARENLASQVLIANKNARFLRLWYETYRDYKIDCWYCNNGIKPTQEVLVKTPYLVHRMWDLVAAHDGMVTKIFMEKWPKWRQHYAHHLLVNHQYLLKNVSSEATFPVEFDENNIKKYPVTFKEMVYDVYPMDDVYKE